MRRFVAAFAFFVVFLAPVASAWGPVAHQSFCRKAVIEVWGADVADDCLATGSEYGGEFCDLAASIAGSRYEDGCAALSVGDIHPANIPEEFFNDWEEHVDYSECPVGAKLAREWVCGDPDVQTTVDKARSWFDAAASADETCARVHAFCVGANYLSDRYQSPHRIPYESDDCHRIIDERVDEAIVAGQEDWEVVQYCRLERVIEKAGQRVSRSYRHRFSVSAGDARDALAAVTEEARRVEAAAPPATAPATSTSMPPSTIAAPSTTVSVPEPATTVAAASTVPVQAGDGEAPDRDSKRSAMLLFMALIVLGAAALIIIAMRPVRGRADPAPKPALKVEAGSAKIKKQIPGKKPAPIVSPERRPKDLAVPKQKDETEELVDDLWAEEGLEAGTPSASAPAGETVTPEEEKAGKPKKKRASGGKKKPAKKKGIKKSAGKAAKKGSGSANKNGRGSEAAESGDEQERPRVRSRYRTPRRKGRY